MILVNFLLTLLTSITKNNGCTDICSILLFFPEQLFSKDLAPLFDGKKGSHQLLLTVEEFCDWLLQTHATFFKLVRSSVCVVVSCVGHLTVEGLDPRREETS